MNKWLILFFLVSSVSGFSQSRYGPNDTLVVPFIVYEGDTMTYRVMDQVFVWGKMSDEQRKAHREWTRLRNAVYVTYPYAIKASAIINDVNSYLANVTDEKKRKKYLSLREKELKKEFTEPLTNLSVYQGKILMKLINDRLDNRFVREFIIGMKNTDNITSSCFNAFVQRIIHTLIFFTNDFCYLIPVLINHIHSSVS